MAQGGTERRIRSPDGIAEPPGDYASWDDYMHAFEVAETIWRDDEAQRGLKAMRLAPNLLVYQALMDGQQVPADALDQHWRKRYGL